MIIDDIQQHRRAKEDSYQIDLLTTQVEMPFFRPTDAQFVHMNRRLHAMTQAHQNAQGRLLAQKFETRQQLQDLKLDFHPIRYISNQSNIKGLIIKKQNYCLGWLPQNDRYVLLQNTSCPSESEVLRHISYEPGCNLSNFLLSVFNIIH